jgi:hypothetical protein
MRAGPHEGPLRINQPHRRLADFYSAAVAGFCSAVDTHLSPLGWEHVNLTGDYVWSPAEEATEKHDGFRPLRPAPDPALLAA